MVKQLMSLYKKHKLYYVLQICEIWFWHSGAVEDSGLVGCDAVTFGVCFLKF